MEPQSARPRSKSHRILLGFRVKWENRANGNGHPLPEAYPRDGHDNGFIHTLRQRQPGFANLQANQLEAIGRANAIRERHARIDLIEAALAANWGGFRVRGP